MIMRYVHRCENYKLSNIVTIGIINNVLIITDIFI